MDHNLRDVLMPLAIIGTFGSVVIFFTRTITDYILKKRLIERGLANEQAMFLFQRQTAANDKLSSLKWGLIMLFGGLSLIILEFMVFDDTSTLPYGVIAVAVAAAFLIYYAVAKREEKNKS